MKSIFLLIFAAVLFTGCWGSKREDKTSVVEIKIQRPSFPDEKDTVTISYYDHLSLYGTTLTDGNGNNKAYNVCRFSILSNDTVTYKR